MTYLPLENVLHHRLRSVLSAIGIGIGICMMITIAGLSRGSLNEAADRWESVDAQLMALPKGSRQRLVKDMNWQFIEDGYADKFRAHKGLVQRVAPVYMWRIKIGGQDNLVSGIDNADWDMVSGGRKLLQGRLPDQDGRCARWLEYEILGWHKDEFAQPATAAAEGEPATISDEQIAAHGGLEIVVDERLARKAHFTLGQMVEAEGHQWKVVGIAPAGVITRVFMPRRVAQHYFGNHSLGSGTLQFIKLRGGVHTDQASAALAVEGTDVVPLTQYRAQLEQELVIMSVFVNAVNIIVLTVAFLFIMITLYTMVLQRTREIAILKSCGASRRFILRQVMAESMILTATGTAFGMGLSFAVGRLITWIAPMLTVRITWQWLAIGAGAALAGSIASAIYPAWRAMRVDMVEAFSLE